MFISHNKNLPLLKSKNNKIDIDRVENILESFQLQLSNSDIDNEGFVFQGDTTDNGNLFSKRPPHSNMAIARTISFLSKVPNDLPNSRNILMNESFGYQFPKKEIVDNFCSKEEYNNQDIINQSPGLVRSWLLNNLLDPIDPARIHVVLGRMGSGKSIFCQYLDVCFDSEAKDVDFLICKYGYSDLEKFFDAGDDEDIDRDRILNKMSCEVRRKLLKKYIYSIMEFDQPRIVDETNSISRQLNSLVMLDEKYKNLSEHKIASLVGKIKAAVNDIKNNAKKPPSAINSDPLMTRINTLFDDQEVELIIEFIFSTESWNALVIIDGFDVFSLDKIVKDRQNSVIKLIRDLVRGNISILPHVGNVKYLLTLRSCTYEYFNIGKDTENSPTHATHILAPASHDVIAKAKCEYIKYLISVSSGKDEADKVCVENLVDNILFETKKIISKDGPFSVVSLFNENYRRMLFYLADVFGYYVNMITFEKKLINHEGEFYSHLCDKENVYEHVTISGLFEILLKGRKKVYKNYNTKDELRIVPNQERGYVDNVFNYTDPLVSRKNTTVSLVLLKLRIMQIISRNKVHMNFNQITENLLLCGYDLNKDVIESNLDLLLSSGFIKPRRRDINNGELKYDITYKGKFVIEKFVTEIRYMELVSQKVLLPKKVRGAMYSSIKYCVLEDAKNPDIEWLYYSINNVFVFIKYLEYIENSEIDRCGSSSKRHICKSEKNSVKKIRKKVFRSIKGMLLKPINKKTEEYLCAKTVHSILSSTVSKLG